MSVKYALIGSLLCFLNAPVGWAEDAPAEAVVPPPAPETLETTEVKEAPVHPCERLLPQKEELKSTCKALETEELQFQVRSIEQVEPTVLRCARTVRSTLGVRLQMGVAEFPSRREAEGVFLAEEKKARETPGAQRLAQLGDRAFRYHYERAGYVQDRFLLLKGKRLYTFQSPLLWKRQATQLKTACSPVEFEQLSRKLLSRLD